MPETDKDPYEPTLQPETHLWDYVHALLGRRRVVLTVFFAVVAAATLRVLLMQPVYEGTAQLLIDRADANILNFQEISQVDAAKDDYYQTQYKLLQSRTLARRVMEKLDLLNDPEYGGPRSADQIEALLSQPAGQARELEHEITEFLEDLSVRPVRNSRLVNVSIESKSPELAAKVANTLASLYIQQSLDLRFQTSSEAGQWLGTQIADQRAKVEEFDRQLQALKRQQGLVNIDERRTLLDQRLKELGTALNERKTERLQKEALWRQMSAATNPEELPEVIRSPLVQSLRIELAGLERQEAQLLERYLEQHPEVVKVRNQIRDTQTKIRGEAERIIRAAENDYKAAAAQEASISAALESAKLEALDLSDRAVTHDSQKREVEAAERVLDNLLARAKETDVASELESTNIRIVDPAIVPEDPIRPRKVRDIALGTLLGLLLGIVLAFFLEYLDNTVKTPDDVKTLLGTPLLGVVPELAQPASTNLVLLNEDLDQRFTEGYRVARTALGYAWSTPTTRILVVTSTVPGEGKSLTSVNLALSLAAHDGRVLLVDADLRKPVSHELLRRPRTPGLAEVLVGKAAPSEAVQQELEGTSLAYLPSGTHVPSPADLMSDRTLRGLLDGLREYYDWIVVDTPPVGSVAEPLILGPLSDGIVIVVGAEMVPARAVQHTLERLEATGTRILGAILNRAQVYKHAYYYAHYYGRYYEPSLGKGLSADVPKTDGIGSVTPSSP